MKTADAASWFQTQQDNDLKYQRKTKQYILNGTIHRPKVAVGIEYRRGKQIAKNTTQTRDRK